MADKNDLKAVAVQDRNSLFSKLFGLSIFLLFSVGQAGLGLTGLFSFILFLLSAVYLLAVRPSIELEKTEKLFVFGMLLYPTATLVSIVVHDTESWKYLDNPSRIALALLVFFTVRSSTVKIDGLHWGVVIGAITVGCIALYQHHILGIGRVYGYISFPNNPITFGNAALLLGVLSVFSIHTIRSSIGMLAYPTVVLAIGLGVYASLLSGTRGGWVSLPFLAYILLNWQGRTGTKSFLLAMILVTIGFFVASQWIPGVEGRLGSAWNELYSILIQGEWTSGSVGTRLHMWYAAFLAFLDSPLLGVGLGNYFDFKKLLIENQIVMKSVISFPYAHNEMIHYLGEIGLFGFVPLLLLYISWLVLALVNAKKRGKTRDIAYMGLVIIVFRFDIALTEVQFVYHFTTLFYVMLFAIVAGFMCRPIKTDAETLSLQLDK